MNAFYEHHKHSIRFGYACFDRLLLNAMVQPFLQPERVVGFFSQNRQIFPVTRQVLGGISEQYHHWVEAHAQAWKAPLEENPPGRRDDFVRPWFSGARSDRIVGIIKAREPAWILTSVGKQSCHLEMKQRWVKQYSFYINDREWGKMFVRVCPYFPFSARVYLNQHHWLAEQMRRRGIRFQQDENAFLQCGDPAALQHLADSLQPEQIIDRAQKWLAYLTPFFSHRERQQQGCQHRLFFAQVEYCNNLIFRRGEVLDQLHERLLDANRSIGRPQTMAQIFGRRINRRYKGKLQTTIQDLDLGHPLIRSHYKSSIAKQYAHGRTQARVEAATDKVTDFGVNKSVENLCELRQRMHQITENYWNTQQDILETFLNRGELLALSRPTIHPNGKRVPGLKLDHPKQLALMQALVRFRHLVTAGSFTTAELLPLVATALPGVGCTLGSVRYELSKLRAKKLVDKLEHTRRYQLTATGYRLCVVYLKLFEKVYAPLVSGLSKPVGADATVPIEKTSPLDKLYLAVARALDQLLSGVGLQVAA
jgi:hypothetical protein